MPPLSDFVRAHETWLHETIDALVSIESPTDDKAAVDRAGAEFRRRAASIGMRVTVESRADAGDHSVAEIGEGGRRILIVGHVDTVWPHGQIARMPLVRRDGRLWGPGTLDMKVGVSMGLLATRAVFETGRPPEGRLAMLITSDEETGSDTSRDVIEREALASDAVLVLEPALAGGPLKTSRKGIGQFVITATGVSAHAGVDPAKGVSAVRELARQIIAIEALHDLQRGVSVNAGVISGGTRPNVVAEEARASVPRPLADTARREAGGQRRLRAAADGALRRCHRALSPRRSRGGGTRPGNRRGRHRRRIRRQSHGRARGADARRPGRGG